MPPVIIPPLLRWALATLGGAAIARWTIREMHRINAELDRVRASPDPDSAARQEMPTLKRDPASGEWRVV